MLSKIEKKLKYLEPNGASRRTIYTLPKTFDKAYKEIQSMQKKYNNEREELRMGLHTPIKLAIRDQLSIIDTKPYQKIKFTPRLVRKHIVLHSCSKSPSKLHSSGASAKQLESLNEIMTSCDRFDKLNKKIRRCIPQIEKKTKKHSRIVNDIVNAINISPSISINECITSRRIIQNTEDKVFSSRKLSYSKSLMEIQSQSYLQHRLAKKKLLMK